jgi:raffinose/stachyose/melibiose transport system permease protein
MKKSQILLIVAGILVSLIMIIPFFWGLMLSFKNNYEIFSAPLQFPSHYDFSLYVDTFKKAHILILFKNSLLLAIVTSVIELIVLFFSSFAIARLNHKYNGMSDFFYYIFLSASAVPVMTLLLPYYYDAIYLGKVTGGLLGLDSIWGLLLPYIAGGIPFLTLMMVGGMKTIPLEMEEAGIIDGAGLWRLIFKIDLPLMSPVIVTLFIFSFLGVWNEFQIASIMLNNKENFTIPLALSFFKDQFSADYGAILRGVVMILLPQALFYLILQRRIIDGMVSSGIKG